MSIHSSSQGAVIQALNVALPDSPADDSVHDYLERAAGEPINNTITLSANNTTASENIFQLTGTIQVFRIYADVTDATTLANCTSASFDLYDSTSAVQITAATGVLSGVAVGTSIAKLGLAAVAFDVNDATDGAYSEQTYEGSDVFSGCLLTQKNGANTYIRFTYTTTDAPINAQLKVFVEYRGVNGGTLAAV